MKKILAILIMLVTLLASCDTGQEKTTKGYYSIYVETIRGHEYIIMQGDLNGNIIHSESCPCKKGGNNE